MNNTTHQSHQPLYPSISSPTDEEFAEPSDHKAASHHDQPPATQPHVQPPATQPHVQPPATQPHDQPPATSSAPPCDDSAGKWPGTHIMGQPAVPTCHPDNKKAALWGAGDQAQYHHHPYLQIDPIEKPSNSPMESILHKFNGWSNKAETMAQNIWQNLKTNSSVSGAAWGKMNLTAKAITGGGFESLYKQTFSTNPNEKLRKTFASYLSTSTGPVAGTMYLSDAQVAFCSDLPLSFTSPSGQETWSYYKVMLPLGKIGAINPVHMRDNPSEKYIQILTIDGHDFWFMGFINFDKASKHLSESISNIVAPGIPDAPVVGKQE